MSQDLCKIISLNTSLFSIMGLASICSLQFFFSKDIFIFQGKDYIGALQSVSIKRDSSGGSPEWFLDTVGQFALRVCFSKINILYLYINLNNSYLPISVIP